MPIVHLSHHMVLVVNLGLYCNASARWADWICFWYLVTTTGAQGFTGTQLNPQGQGFITVISWTQNFFDPRTHLIFQPQWWSLNHVNQALQVYLCESMLWPVLMWRCKSEQPDKPWNTCRVGSRWVWFLVLCFQSVLCPLFFPVLFFRNQQ